jgi:hypothetical protein
MITRLLDNCNPGCLIGLGVGVEKLWGDNDDSLWVGEMFWFPTIKSSQDELGQTMEGLQDPALG